MRDSYKKTAQKYKKELMSAIKLPVYIFSGKIIQNYPLGLGIYADVDNTKVIFKSEQKDEDVFNVLSTGQLNGLAISVLLAIHDVYKENFGIDILLIDDPLQTIDDISAISLADLLAELNMDGQIILSTHEQQKAEMFRYKFAQRGFAYQSEDMEERFFSSNC